MEKTGVVIGGHYFNKSLFDFLITRFKESFSHASLSVEKAFENLHDCEAELISICDENAYEYYRLLDSKEKSRIAGDLRRFIVFYGYNCGVLSGSFDVNSPQKDVDVIFQEHFKYMSKDMLYVIQFDSGGQYLQRDTFRNVGHLFRLAFEKNTAKETAYNMQKDHMDAFDYAMSLDDIGATEIIEINERVNHTRPEKEVGYKKMNNTITGAKFEVTDKTAVPTEVQRLLAEYKKHFGYELLDPDDSTITSVERSRRLLKWFEVEALFHIRFERIHPFADGNGRTGRIIMNKHLIDNGFAPVLITDFMTEEYRNYIGNYDYEGLARMMLSSSSQLLSNWNSMKRAGIYARKILSNEKLAEFLQEDYIPEKKYKSKRSLV